MDIYTNEYFTLISEDNKLYISVYRPGYDMRDFNKLLLAMPTIQLHNFTNLKNALEEPSAMRIYIGNIKPRVEVILSIDEMEARIKLNITAKEFSENKTDISSEIIEALNEAGVTDGLIDLLQKPFTVQKEVPAAMGIRPQDGKDAVIRYFEIHEKKPVVKEDGSVNHYELNLIDNVRKSDWLGEKLPPTDGKPGKTVTGRIIPARRGLDLKLKYDRKTIAEYEEEGKIVLRALIDGAVKFEGDKIKIDNHLIIPGDVGYETGNINFDGYVTVKGTIKDGFSVTAKNDISIQGEMGLGVIDRIVSKEGSIYIKGGIFGKNASALEAKKSVYVKYCNACKITAGEDINVGFYALDSTLKAKNILLDPVYGKIIGGTIQAEIQVVTGIIGNKTEKKTYINVSGFDRTAIKNEFEKLLGKYKEMLEEINKVKRQIELFEYNISGAEYVNSNEYNAYVRKYENILEEIRMLDEYRKRLQKILETKGEGEVGIFKAAYPETYLEIKNIQKRISSVVSGCFYAADRELHQG